MKSTKNLLDEILGQVRRIIPNLPSDQQLTVNDPEIWSGFGTGCHFASCREDRPFGSSIAVEG